MKSTRSKSTINIFTLFAFLASLLGSAVIVTPAYAAGIAVNSDADTVADDGTCTLREAITNANADSQLYATAGECAAGAGTDTITFAADYTITLVDSQLPAITTAIIIIGNGAANTVVQANANPNTATNRIVEVTNTGNLTLNYLTIRNGRCRGICSTLNEAGGGIINIGGTLSINNSTVSDNSAYLDGGGIYNTGALTVTNSMVSDNSTTIIGSGGGIFNSGSLIITNSTFSNNSTTNGAGGGIVNSNSGAVTITNSTFSGNSTTNGGGGVSNDGTLTIANSLISGNSTDSFGGGIANVGTLIMTNSTLSSNSAPGSGGILNDDTYGGGVLTITSSTISNNSATEGDGGGIYNNGTLTITNSTISSNSAISVTSVSGRGGGIISDGTLTITNSTLSNNVATSVGGSLANYGTLNYINTIIANSSSGGDCVNYGTLGTNTNNLVEDSSCSASLSVDPLLDTLADNGGPTQTFALLANSPAIDAGDDATCAASPVSNLDQRGIARPNGGHCDIGAYEYVDTTAPVVTDFTVPASPTTLNIPITTFTASDDAVVIAGYLITESATPPAVGAAGWTASAPTTYPVASMGSYTLYPWAKDAAGHVSAVYGSPATVNITCLNSITVMNNNDSGPGSLRQTISDACVGDINNISMIDFDSALSGETIHLASELTIAKNVTIDGSDLDEPITISGNTDPAGAPLPDGVGDVRVFSITGGSPGLTVMLDSLIVTKGVTSGHGAGLFMEQGMHVTIKNSTFSDNHAGGRGGGIGNQGSLTLIDSTVSGNSAASTDGGGGISNESGMTMTNSTISDNHATGAGASGGGLFNTGGATITNSTIFGNSTTTYGGGIATTANLTITNSTIAGNSASFTGGLQVDGNVTHLRNTIIANNTNTSSTPGFNNDCTDTSDYPNPASPDGDGIMTNVNNLIGDGSCPAGSTGFQTGAPGLGALADNGGPTQTLALLHGSAAIDSGNDATCAVAPVSGLDQRGFTRPSGVHCDIGSYEDVDTIAPTVLSSTRVGISPTNFASVDFTVTFSESVTGVDATDFTLAKTGAISGETVSGVSGSGTTYTVTVNTGTGDGTLRLDVLDDNSIIDGTSNPLDGGFTSGEVYSILKSVPYANVQVTVAGASQGNFSVASKNSARKSYAGLNNGPVKVISTLPMVASERVAYSPDGGTTWTSHSELMGLPANQVATSYTFPWYNNLDLNSQLRFGNVGTAPTTVTVTIAGVFRGNYTLAPNASQRVSYPGLDSGPVKVTSSGNVPIIASLRIAYFNGSAWTSFSEMMGMPSPKLTSSYVFPWYNNFDLNSQLRFGNVGTVPTTVTVTIGGMFKGNYILAPNESKRVSYPALDKGPVRVTSSGNVPIIASMRVAYHNGTAWTDFSEMMGMPSSSLSTHYSFPVYDNVLHNSQLRFGNVGNVSTDVTVTINGVLKGTYNLAPNASLRISYPGLSAGPVVIQSSGNVPIIASERVAYHNGTAWSSFAEMMGLPQSQLSTTFLFPWYNNIDLDTQLRFGVP